MFEFSEKTIMWLPFKACVISSDMEYLSCFLQMRAVMTSASLTMAAAASSASTPTTPTTAPATMATNPAPSSKIAQVSSLHLFDKN